jgi:hypothetical protein
MKRFVLLCCALALAPSAQAQTTDWTVDPESHHQSFSAPSEFERRRMKVEFGSLDLGAFKVAPMIKVWPKEHRFDLADPEWDHDAVEIGFRAYSKDRPGLAFIGRALYRELVPKEDERHTLADMADPPPPFGGANVDLMEGDGYSAGFTCKFPLMDCLKKK